MNVASKGIVNVAGDLILRSAVGNKIRLQDLNGVDQAIIDTATGALGLKGTSPAASALLDLSGSTTQALLMPKLTTTQRDAISAPPAGLTIYNTTTNKLNVFTTGWEAVTSA